MADHTIAELHDRWKPVSIALEADGFRLEEESVGAERVRARTMATSAPCADYLVPKPIMTPLITDASGDAPLEFDLLSPADA